MPSIKRLLEITFPVPHIKAAVNIAPIILNTGVFFVDSLLSTFVSLIEENINNLAQLC